MISKSSSHFKPRIQIISSDDPPMSMTQSIGHSAGAPLLRVSPTKSDPNKSKLPLKISPTHHLRLHEEFEHLITQQDNARKLRKLHKSHQNSEECNSSAERLENDDTHHHPMKVVEFINQAKKRMGLYNDIEGHIERKFSLFQDLPTYFNVTPILKSLANPVRFKEMFNEENAHPKEIHTPKIHHSKPPEICQPEQQRGRKIWDKKDKKLRDLSLDSSLPIPKYKDPPLDARRLVTPIKKSLPPLKTTNPNYSPPNLFDFDLNSPFLDRNLSEITPQEKVIWALRDRVQKEIESAEKLRMVFDDREKMNKLAEYLTKNVVNPYPWANEDEDCFKWYQALEGNLQDEFFERNNAEHIRTQKFLNKLVGAASNSQQKKDDAEGKLNAGERFLLYSNKVMKILEVKARLIYQRKRFPRPNRHKSLEPLKKESVVQAPSLSSLRNGLCFERSMIQTKGSLSYLNPPVDFIMEEDISRVKSEKMFLTAIYDTNPEEMKEQQKHKSRKLSEDTSIDMKKSPSKQALKQILNHGSLLSSNTRPGSNLNETRVSMINFDSPTPCNNESDAEKANFSGLLVERKTHCDAPQDELNEPQEKIEKKSYINPALVHRVNKHFHHKICALRKQASELSNDRDVIRKLFTKPIKETHNFYDKKLKELEREKIFY